MEPRIVAALVLSAASATTVATALLMKLRQAKADRLRRRGIKSYNRIRSQRTRVPE